VATFAILVNFTSEGAKTIGDSKNRYQKFEQGLKEAGGRVVASYGLLGEYDILVVAEAPDEKAIAKVVLAAVSRGTVSTKTLPAIPIKEFYEIVDQALGAVAARR